MSATEHPATGSPHAPTDPGTLACRSCRLPVTTGGVHAVTPPWPHSPRMCDVPIGWTTRGLAVFAAIPAYDPQGRSCVLEVDYGYDGDVESGDCHDTVLGRWWDVARQPFAADGDGWDGWDD